MSTLERVKKLCKNHGISVPQLEDRLGIPNNTIYQWKGNKRPNLDKIEKIADYFNVSTDYLLGRSDIKEKADELESLAAHRDGLNLTPEEEEAIERFVKHVLRNEE